MQLLSVSMNMSRKQTGQHLQLIVRTFSQLRQLCHLNKSLRSDIKQLLLRKATSHRSHGNLKEISSGSFLYSSSISTSQSLPQERRDLSFCSNTFPKNNLCHSKLHRGKKFTRGDTLSLYNGQQFRSSPNFLASLNTSTVFRMLTTLSTNLLDKQGACLSCQQTRLKRLSSHINDDIRFYSKNNGNKKDEDIDDFMKDINSDKVDLGKDLDIKAILDDIKSDFREEHNTSSSSSESDSSSSSDEETCVVDGKIQGTAKNKNNNSTGNSQTEEYEYDYRYADDIEDFGFDGEAVEDGDKPEKVVPISLTRGKDGVFDLDELLTFLDHLGAENVVTVDVPPEANYCQHMVISSAKSQRHLQFINDEFLWMHKRKKGNQDTNLHIEGLNRSEWSAMDLGNIVLHVFYGNAREYYDIESLWQFGPENDPKCQGLGHDPLALSEEDLFWMEASKMQGKDTDVEGGLSSKFTSDSASVTETIDGSLDQEAGWGPKKPRNPR